MLHRCNDNWLQGWLTSLLKGRNPAVKINGVPRDLEASCNSYLSLILSAPPSHQMFRLFSFVIFEHCSTKKLVQWSSIPFYFMEKCRLLFLFYLLKCYWFRFHVDSATSILFTIYIIRAHEKDTTNFNVLNCILSVLPFLKLCANRCRYINPV